jgi:putative hydrolase of HD superfamily
MASGVRGVYSAIRAMNPRPIDHANPMHPSDLDGILDFLRAAEQLKNVTRTSWTSAGHRESVASHTWRLCLMALVLEKGFPGVDFARLLKICIIHDLGEAIGGDIPAIEQISGASKAPKERADLLELLRPLPDGLRTEITALWDEYEAAATPEARIAKALDKLETIMQHNQGKNPRDFDYRFNLDYGKRFTAGDPLIVAIREILDRETEQRATESDAAP